MRPCSAACCRCPAGTSSTATRHPLPQVRGPDAIRNFSVNLLTPYKSQPRPEDGEAPLPAVAGSNSLLEELRRTVEEQRRRIAELEAQLAAGKK